ncbi:MAG: class I SAM-dependent methyltransferase [Spirochaetales bacterium]|nr:class I SAM-dependent methyltransferase [Spirochaetales bacterium]
MKEAQKSSIGAAFFRAVEMLYPEGKRLFNDPYAENYLTLPYKFFLQLMKNPEKFKSLMEVREKMTPGLLGWMYCRTRYIDDVLEKCLADGSIDAVVNLGAGMDTRVFRIPGIEKIPYFEIDHPSVIRFKRKKNNKFMKQVPENLVYVPVDFNRQDFKKELKQAGYSEEMRALFIWEGVTQYIPKEVNEDTFSFFSKTKKGSLTVFTYIPSAFLQGSFIPAGLEKFHDSVVNKKKLWIHGYNPSGLQSFLSRYNIVLEEDNGAKEFLPRYIEPVQPGVSVFEIERTALGKVI